MILEQLIFSIIAFGLFVYMFFRMFQKNDTNYISILVIQAIGITLNFIAVLAKKEIGAFWVIVKYIFGILLPIAIIIIEKRGISFLEHIKEERKQMEERKIDILGVVVF